MLEKIVSADSAEDQNTKKVQKLTLTDFIHDKGETFKNACN